MKNVRHLFAALALIGCAFAYAEGGAPHWGYVGRAGAAHWGDLDKGFAECKLGKEQSPINIVTKKVQRSKLPPLKLTYQASDGELINNGHTIQIDLTDGGDAVFPSGDYKLVQFHFHTPSEEEINGKRFPLVAHLVHRNAAGNLAVIAILFKQGKENAALKNLFAGLPAKEGKEPLKTEFDASALLPTSLGYYSFKGSLTTPPCSEGVAWYVLRKPVELSAAQIEAFRKIFKMNARPVQPLNGRVVLESN